MEHHWREPSDYWVIGYIWFIAYLIKTFLVRLKKAVTGFVRLVMRLAPHGKQRRYDTESGTVSIEREEGPSPNNPAPQTRAEDAKNKYHHSLSKTFGDGHIVQKIMSEINKWEIGV